MIYKISLTPLTSFGTFIKGDMLFGFFNYWWEKRNKEILENIVFSDFLPEGYIYKPLFPLNKFGQINDDEKKAFKSIKWVYIGEKKFFNFKNFKNSWRDIGIKEGDFFERRLAVRNSLNRLTFTTDKDFSVYSEEEFIFKKNIDLFVSCKNEFINKIVDFLDELGSYGIGKNGNIKGKFKINCFVPYKIEKYDLGIALSPIISKDVTYYDVFTRYGKYFASSKPFKKPVLMCDSGSVVNMRDVIMGENKENGYTKRSIIQGKSIIFPIKEF